MFGEDHVVFRGNGGGSVATCRVQTGGVPIENCLPMRGGSLEYHSTGDE